MRFRPRLALALLLPLAASACNRAPAPKPCRAGGEPAPKIAWAKPDEWRIHTLPQPGNGWISSIAVSHDGKLGVYGGTIGGAFIPISEEVTLIRFEIGPEMDTDLKPMIMTLPGPALRNFAALAWSRPGLAWGSWSTLGTAVPATAEVKRLREIPIPEGKEKRDTFPFHSSVAWSPAGDCVAATVELPGTDAELVTWNAAGARAASARHDIESLEKIAAWTSEGVILVASTSGSSARVRRIDPGSGAFSEAQAVPKGVEAFTWAGGGWLTVDPLGTVMHHVAGADPVLVASVPGALEIGLGEKRRWLRVLASENGRAIVVEESVVAPKAWAPGSVSKDLRHMHVLTPKVP